MNPQAIGQLVLAHDFALDAAVAQVTAEQVNAAIASYEAARRPMREAAPNFLDADVRSANKALKEIAHAIQMIGAKIAPTMAGEQAKMWRDSILVSLSKYPVNAVRAATAEAMCEPFKFMGDVDPKLHALAERAADRARDALWRLNRMREEIARAADPLPALPAPPEITPETLAALARSTQGQAILGFGLTAGHIEREEYEAAMQNAPDKNEGLVSDENEGYTASTEGKPED